MSGLIFEPGKIDEGLQTFKFLTFKSEIEFAAWGFKAIDSDEQGFAISRWNENTFKKSLDVMGSKIPKDRFVKTFFIHSHPSLKQRYGYGNPSDADKNGIYNTGRYPTYILSRREGVHRYWPQSPSRRSSDLDQYFNTVRIFAK